MFSAKYELLRTFCSAGPLFSTPYELFCQKHPGWGGMPPKIHTPPLLLCFKSVRVRQTMPFLPSPRANREYRVLGWRHRNRPIFSSFFVPTKKLAGGAEESLFAFLLQAEAGPGPSSSPS